MSSSLFYSILHKNFPYKTTLKQDVFFQKIAIFLTETDNRTIFVLKTNRMPIFILSIILSFLSESI